MKSVIGIDFDNTIISYDNLIHKIALEKNLIPPHFTKSKTKIRDHLRQLPGGEIEWQKIQALIYGPRITEANLIDGVKEFLKDCKDNGIKVYIISHKTEHSNLYQGGTNFRTSALNWMKENIFSDLLSEKEVYFTPTQDEKIQTVANLGCTHFIDDLEEIFGQEIFPGDVKKILFDPHGKASIRGEIAIFTTWNDIHKFCFTGITKRLATT